jgi:hypothetical protein
MVLIWTGRGILVFIIFIVMAVLALIFTVTEISEPYDLTVDQGTNLTIAIAAFLSSLLTFPIGRLVMKQPREKSVTDPQTGQAHLLQTYDTLLWIDVTYWTYIFAVIAVVMAAVTFLV